MIDRRSLLTAGGLAGLAALAGCSGQDGAGQPENDAEPKQLRFAWWGHEEMNRTTREALELYHQQKDLVTLTPENASWDDFWDRMATQIAGRNGPDCFQMSNQMIVDYAERGALLDLEPYIGEEIDLAGWDENLRGYGIIDDARAGVPISTDAFMIMYDVAVIEKLKITMPEAAWTWDDLAARSAEIREAGGGELWGMSDGSGKYELLEPWVRGRGKSFYAFDADPVTLGFEREDLGDFLQWWADRRAEGACVPPDVAAEDDGHETSALVTGKAPIYFTTSSELLGVRALTEHPCQAMPVPDQAGGEKKANFVRPNLFMSAWTGTKFPRECARFLNFWINDPDAVDVIGASRGVPPSPKSAERLASKVEPADVRSPFEYVELIREIGSPMDGLTPKSGRDVYNLLQRTAEGVRFGQTSVPQAVEAFFTEAASLLSS